METPPARVGEVISSCESHRPSLMLAFPLVYHLRSVISDEVRYYMSQLTCPDSGADSSRTESPPAPGTETISLK